MGDLDSLNPTIRQHYEKLNVPIDEDPDQYSTDFTKCLKYLNSHAAEIIASSPRSQQQQKSTTETRRQQQTLEIVILGGLGGRVDQAFSQIHHLYMMTQTQRELRESKKATTTSQSDSGSHIQNDSDKFKKKLGSDSDSDSAAGGNLYLVSEESITFVLQKGQNIIHTPATNRPLQGQGDGVENGDVSRKRKRENDTQDALPLPPPPPPPASTSTSTLSAADGATESDAEKAVEYLFEENIGIIPLSASASITTTGFEWDVENWHTEIGGQLSTSNHIRSDIVSVETNVPVLFTVELSERLKRRMKG